MIWIPPPYADTCSANPGLNSCQPGILTFLTLISQYLSNSDVKFYPAPEHVIDNTRYDFIIVGAGTAGCVVASRLSEIKNWKILLLEEGDEEPLAADIPTMWTSQKGTSIDYSYKTEPEPQAASPSDRKAYSYTSGKVMGGSSSLNGMYYVRGNKQDFDDWESFGNKGWSWKDVLPYFKKSEDAKSDKIFSPHPTFHGTGGYLKVDHSYVKDTNGQALLDAWDEVGLSEIEYNSGDQIGSSRVQYTAFNGIRQSTNRAFILPIRRRRSNLTIKPNTRVTKIIIDKKTQRAIGVEYVSKKKEKVTKKVYAKKEVIISSGFVGSPKLLLLSGIGPANDLKNLNVDVINDLPVGKNLQDHIYATSVLLQVKNNASNIPNSQVMTEAVFDWLHNRRGKLSDIGGVGVTAFYQTPFEKRSGVVDIQYFPLGLMKEKSSQSSSFNFIPDVFYDTISLSTILLTPKSQGYLKLNKQNPSGNQPEIYFNYLSDLQDLKTLMEGLKFARKFVKAEALKKQGLVESMIPVPGCRDYDYQSDEYLECLIKKYSGVGYHAVGTCRMGPENDSSTVVNSRLKVHSVNGLRVIDASVMPTITRGNTMAPTIMIAEKGSDMIKEEWL